MKHLNNLDLIDSIFDNITSNYEINKESIYKPSSPVNNKSPSPENNKSPSPVNNKSPSPVNNKPSSPVNNKPLSLENNKLKSPENNKLKSSENIVYIHKNRIIEDNKIDNVYLCDNRIGNNKIDNVIRKRTDNYKKTSKNKYINQLFRIMPDFTFIENFIKLFIPNGFDEYYLFTKDKIITNRIVEKMQSFYYVQGFKNIYMPCKYKKYFSNLNYKKCVTILRQILKLYNYKLVSKEKYEHKQKKLFYSIKKIGSETPPKKNLILTFD